MFVIVDTETSNETDTIVLVHGTRMFLGRRPNEYETLTLKAAFMELEKLQEYERHRENGNPDRYALMRLGLI